MTATSTFTQLLSSTYVPNSKHWFTTSLIPSLEEGTGKRCSECAYIRTALLLILYTLKANRTEDLRWCENLECLVVAVVVDRFYIALFSALEQTHCTLVAHSEHRFPAPSSKLCQIWLRH